MKGAWSSSSSRLLACIDPSWVRRAWTGSTGALPASPKTMSRIDPAASAATSSGRMGTGSDLDVDDFGDEHEPDEHHDPAEAEDDDARREPEDAGRVLE